MMKITKRVWVGAISLVLTCSNAFAGAGWLTNISEAQDESKRTQKPLFIEFTGSDWCPPCIMMEKAVFSKEKFLKGAKKDFILVKIDIPQGDQKLTEKNQKVLEEYGVTGVPTVLLLDEKGQEISRFSASRYNTVDKMLSELKRQLRIKDMF